MTYRDKLSKRPKYPDKTGWTTRHLAAIESPKASEIPIVALLTGWLDYADYHRQAYQSGIGDDGVLGPDWACIGAAIRRLLNGDCGRLDCGTLDGILCSVLKAENFDPDNL